MPSVWPQDKIRELIALAESGGSSSATLTSETEATNFRFAIYNFRREHRIGLDLMVTIEENLSAEFVPEYRVKLTRKEEPSVTILH